MKCFYHVDEDGKCAGSWVFYKETQMSASKKKPDPSCFYKINYGMHFPIEEIKQDERIYIVDYSIHPDEMRELLKITKNVIWIDHHISSINKYDGFEYNIAGIRYNGVAGCELTYCYLFLMVDKDPLNPFRDFNVDMLKKVPKPTKYIGDHDVWKFQFGIDTTYFTLAMESIPNNEPYDEIWESLRNFNTMASDLINEGRIMMQYKDTFAKEYLQSKGFETTFEGYKVLAMNVGLAGSDWFNSIDKSQYDILMVFSTGSGRYWSYSLFSETVDVSKIAVKYGGGGHVGAAGFSSKKLLLKKPDTRTFSDKIKSLFTKKKTM